MTYLVDRLGTIPARPPQGGVVRLPLRERFDVGAFGVSALRAEKDGAEVIGEHEERSGHEELYLVLSGHAVFTVAGDEVDAPTGTLVFVRDPAAKRKAVARESGTVVLAVGGPRGEAFTPSPWEEVSGMWETYGKGDYEGCVEYLRGVLLRYPDDPGALYNLACCEALAGRLHDLAREDEDFAPLREDPRFQVLLAAR